MIVAYRPIDWIDWLPKGKYRVGDDGGVQRCSKGVWKTCKQTKPIGHKGPCVYFKRLGKASAFSVSGLVCRAFHGPKPIGCHPYRFPDKSLENNRASNLKWAPRGACSVGVIPSPERIESFLQAAKTFGESTRHLQEGDVPRVFELKREGWLIQEIADEFGVTRHVIEAVIGGRTYLSVACDRSVPDEVQGRAAARGDRHYAARLTSLDIPEIREKHRSGMKLMAIAREFGVRHSVIWNVIKGKTWAHVPDDSPAPAPH
jgi:hypothetical protein